MIKYIPLLSFILLASCAAKQLPKLTYEESIEKHRAKYKADFLTTSHSPLVADDLQFLSFYEADAKYNCKCKVSVLTGEKPFEIKTYAGDERSYVKYANVDCVIDQDEFTLAVYRSIAMMSMPQYKDHLFLPFMDSTNDEETYGGGRYIDLNKQDFKDGGQVHIDFNKCYNPYCAFSDGYSCPIPPAENHLDIAINAGEKMYRGEKKNRTR